MKDWTERITELSNLVDGRATGHYSAMQQLVAEVQAEERTYAVAVSEALRECLKTAEIAQRGGSESWCGEEVERIAKAALAEAPANRARDSANEGKSDTCATEAPLAARNENAIGPLDDQPMSQEASDAALRTIARCHAQDAVAPIGSREHRGYLSHDPVIGQNVLRQEEIIFYAIKDALGGSKAKLPTRDAVSLGCGFPECNAAGRCLGHTMGSAAPDGLSQCQVQESDLWEQIVFPPVWGPAEAAAMWATENLDPEDVSFALNRYIDTVKLLDAAAAAAAYAYAAARPRVCTGAVAMKPGTQVRRALQRLVDASNEYAGEQFFADDNGMCDTREAKRMDAAIRNAENVLAATARRRKSTVNEE